MDSMSSGRTSTLDYGLLLRRRWWVVLCGLLLGLAFAYAFVVFSPKTYTSTALVLAKPTEADRGQVAGGRTSSPINLDTESQLVRSAVVAAKAKEMLRSPLPPDALVKQVRVQVPANTSVLAISYQAGTASEALQGAHSFAEAYLQNRAESSQAEIAAQVKSLREQIDARRKELADWSGKTAAQPANSADGAFAAAQEKVVLDQISELNGRLSPLVTADVNPGRIITDAQLPPRPSAPIPLLYLTSGLLAGLLFGLLGAGLRERFDRRVRRAEDLEKVFHLPVLLKMGAEADATGRLPSPESPDGQEFHHLSRALTDRLGVDGQVILVTGVEKGGSTGLVAAGLATGLARRGSQVALVCADPLSRSVAQFGFHRDHAWSEGALEGLSMLRHHSGELAHLSVIGGGGGENLSETLQGDFARDFFATLRGHSRYIVVEAPPASDAVETLTLAEYADIALIVAEVPRTNRDEIRECVRRLDRVGVDVVGAAVVPYRRAKRRKTVSPAELAAEPQVSRAALNGSQPAVPPAGEAPLETVTKRG